MPSIDRNGVPIYFEGEEDASLPPHLSREIADALPNASLVFIPQAGHLSALEKPEEITESMLGFLGTVS